MKRILLWVNNTAHNLGEVTDIHAVVTPIFKGHGEPYAQINVYDIDDLLELNVGDIQVVQLDENVSYVALNKVDSSKTFCTIESNYRKALEEIYRTIYGEQPILLSDTEIEGMLFEQDYVVISV